MQTRLSPAHPDNGKIGFSELEDRIRIRAYEVYEQRACEPDHALDHWLQAKSEVLGVEKSQK